MNFKPLPPGRCASGMNARELNRPEQRNRQASNQGILGHTSNIAHAGCNVKTLNGTRRCNRRGTKRPPLPPTAFAVRYSSSSIQYCLTLYCDFVTLRASTGCERNRILDGVDSAAQRSTKSTRISPRPRRETHDSPDPQQGRRPCCSSSACCMHLRYIRLDWRLLRDNHRFRRLCRR